MNSESGGLQAVPPSQHMGGGRQPSPPLVPERLAPEEAPGLFRGQLGLGKEVGQPSRQAFSIVHG